MLSFHIFRANRAGTIINISSGTGVFGAAMASIYCASKFALEGFSEIAVVRTGRSRHQGENRRAGRRAWHRFGRRDPSAKRIALPIPEDYNAFIAHTVKVYGAMATNSNSDAIGRVAEAIFAAATDGAADRLRYMPNEDIRSVLTARRKSLEQNFIALMRGIFLPHPSNNA